MSGVKRQLAAAAMVAMATAGPVSAATMELLANGGFESGSFTGWATFKTPTAAGDFFVVPVSPAGTTSPLNSFPVPPDTDGDNGEFAAVSDQLAPNAVALTQTFTLPVGTTKVELSFATFIDDYSTPSPGASPVGPAFPGGAPGALGPALDETITPSQFVLFDILVSGASPLATLPADVVTTITNPFPTPSFAPGANPWRDSPIFDLTAALVPGGTYQLRFGATDNLGNLLVGLDNVSLKATVIPLPAALPLLAAALAGLAFARRRG